MLLNVKLELLRTGRSQRSLAYQCRLRESRVSELVNGWASPRPDEARTIARVLRKPASVLFAEQSIEATP